MTEQLANGDHEFKLFNIHRPNCPQHPKTNGVLRWSREYGIRYEVCFSESDNIVGTKYYLDDIDEVSGVGRYKELEDCDPDWLAETTDGGFVELFHVEDTSDVKLNSDQQPKCIFRGQVAYARVTIPFEKITAFENCTKEKFRLFFTGHVSDRFTDQDEVRFEHPDGSADVNIRCGVKLSNDPVVMLTASTPMITCKPSGWLSFEHDPRTKELEPPAAVERSFLSFLNGRAISCHWFDCKNTETNCIERTYYGWAKSPVSKVRDPVYFQPLPLCGAPESFSYGNEVLESLPALFRNYCQRSKIVDFEFILNPIRMALEGVLNDQLALVSVSLERLTASWIKNRTELMASPADGDLLWKSKPLLKQLRKNLKAKTEQLLGAKARKERKTRQVKAALTRVLGEFIDLALCRHLTQSQKDELIAVISSRIDNLTGPPNSAKLKQPFIGLDMELTSVELSAIGERNAALHGTTGGEMEIEQTNRNSEVFDVLRMLIIRFVLTLCEYRGPYVDYASRPESGNFEIKILPESKPNCPN